MESKLGQGSRFTVNLMLPWVSLSQTDASQPRRIAGYEGRQRTLMLVDDDPVLRGLLSDLLIPLGFTTLEAQDANACLNMLNQVSPDLFLLDISMPGMNGLELAQTLRDRDISAPIIMLSADAKEYQSKGNAAPAYNDYLVKPVTNQNLLDKLAHHLALNWTYQMQDPADSAPAQSDLNRLNNPQRPNPMVIPDHPAVRELKAFAEIGYTKGVRATLKQLRESDLIQDDTLTYLEHLTRKLQFETLVHCLELDTP